MRLLSLRMCVRCLHPKPCFFPFYGNRPGECPLPYFGNEPYCACRKRESVKVKLADDKERNIQHMTSTTFWNPDGTANVRPAVHGTAFWRAAQDSSKNEAELRTLWSTPKRGRNSCRDSLRMGLVTNDLRMQKIIDAEKSDLVRRLAHVAYALPTMTREERAARARVEYQRAIQQQPASLSRLCAVALH